MKHWNSKTRLAVCVIILAAFCAALRGWVVINSTVTSNDAVSYITPARQMQTGYLNSLRNTPRHPAYPTAIFLAKKASACLTADNSIKTWELSAQFVSITFSLLATIAVFLFARIAFNTKGAFISVIIFTAGRKWVHIGSDVLADSMLAGFCVWAAYLLAVYIIRLKRRKGASLGVAATIGILTGLAYLTKPQGLAMLLACAAVIIGYGIFAKRVSFKNAIGGLTVMAAAFLAVAVPYMLLIGGITKSSGAGDLACGNNLFILAAGSAHEIFTGIDLIAGQLAEFVSPTVSTIVIITVVNAYLVSPLWRPVPVCGLKLRPAKLSLAIIAAALVIFSIPVFVQYMRFGFVSHRYLVVPGCLIAILGAPACGAVAELWTYIWTLSKKILRFDLPLRIIYPAAAVWITAAVLTTGMTIDSASKPLHPGKEIFRHAGAALRYIAPKDNSMIITDSPRIALYSNHPYLPLPADRKIPLEEFYALVKQHNIKYIAVSQDFASPESTIGIENFDTLIQTGHITPCKPIPYKQQTVKIYKFQNPKH